MNEERKALIRYRLAMARGTLGDALLLQRQGGSAWSVVNRAYDAMFYAVLALLTSIGEGSAKHAGVIALFDRHFVKTGAFPPEMSRWLHRAFALRQQGDYRELVHIGPDRAGEVLQWAQTFVDRVDAFLRLQLDGGNDAR